MRQLLVLAIMTTLGLAASAEVIRCADAAGNVSYTDGACSAGSKAVGRVSEPPARQPDAEAAPRQASCRRRQPGTRRRNLQAPPSSTPAARSTGNEQGSDSRWSDRGGDTAVVDDGYGYPGGAYRQPQRPRDMRPRIRSCDAQGCQDKQGNHYDRSGQLDRYQSIDGKTCRPIGTTTVCR